MDLNQPNNNLTPSETEEAQHMYFIHAMTPHQLFSELQQIALLTRQAQESVSKDIEKIA